MGLAFLLGGVAEARRAGAGDSVVFGCSGIHAAARRSAASACANCNLEATLKEGSIISGSSALSSTGLDVSAIV